MREPSVEVRFITSSLPTYFRFPRSCAGQRPSNAQSVLRTKSVKYFFVRAFCVRLNAHYEQFCAIPWNLCLNLSQLPPNRRTSGSKFSPLRTSGIRQAHVKNRLVIRFYDALYRKLNGSVTVLGNFTISLLECTTCALGRKLFVKDRFCGGNLRILRREASVKCNP